MASSSSSSLVQHRTPQLTKLLNAASDCKLRPLQKFLKNGGLPDTLVEQLRQSGVEQVPLIFKAIQYNHYPEHRGSLKLLIDARANTGYVVESLQSTPLMCACEVASSDPLSILLQSGLDPCQQVPSTGMTALHTAAASGAVAKCKLLLEADRRTLDMRTSNAITGCAPIFHAVSAGHLPVVTLLHKEYGASLNVHDNSGDTLLFAAAVRPHSLYVLAYLLRHGLDVNAQNHNGATALLYAAETGNCAALKMLLQHDADPTIPAENGQTALLMAILKGRTAAVELLLNTGMPITARHTANTNKTALMLAASYGYVEVAEQLLQRGADVQAVDGDGNTALHLATCNNKPELISLLLQHGADVNARNQSGETPFCFALVRMVDTKSIQLMLDAGADLTTTTANGLTILHNMHGIASIDVVQLLCY
jgi:uncharacterized protein